MKKRIKDLYEKCIQEGTINLSNMQICFGKALAKEFGYQVEEMSEVSDSHWRTFAGCGNPWKYIEVKKGWKILDLGCGSGIDLLVASKSREDPDLVVGIDLVFDMVKSGCDLFSKSFNQKRKSVFFLSGDGEFLPFKDQVFDLVVCNGVFSLFQDKKKAVEEVFRVLKKPGYLVVCDLIRLSPLPAYFYDGYDAWAWCMAGAPSKSEINQLLRKGGFSISEFMWGKTLYLFARATVVGVK